MNNVSNKALGSLRASISHLREEYEAWQSLLDEQPRMIEHFFVTQARALAEAIAAGTPRAQFAFPAEVVVELLPNGLGEIGYVSAAMREHVIGGILEQIAGNRVGAAVRQRLAELEQSPERAVAVCAGLLRHATAMHMLHHMLPAGRSVTYMTEEGEDIPSIPVVAKNETASALTAAQDAIAEGQPQEDGRGELLVPFVPAARRFYLPQWVAFDDDGRLLVNSLNEAEGRVASMQSYLRILHGAVALAPYVVADPQYQSSRYGMLGQLANQGRALARCEAADIIHTIQQRAAAQDLNRGLAIGLPYFDDQALEMKVYHFEVIPAGRIMFAPVFVARAAEQEQAKVDQDTRLNRSTRRHLLAELKEIETAFSPSTEKLERMFDTL